MGCTSCLQMKYKKIDNKPWKSGGSCQTFKVKSSEGDDIYMLKEMKIRSENDKSRYEEEVSILKMFDNENIVRFIDSEIKNNYFNIIMEFGGDSNLKEFIDEFKNKNNLIDEDIISNIIIQICLGLREIHKKNIMHRDLTPDNIFIDKDKDNNYKIKIGDFGISTRSKTSKEYAGKTEYLAPEIKNGNEYNNKIDIYSLGCIILYQI